MFAKEGAAGVLVADVAIEAAADVVAECKAVATNTRFQAEAVHVDITQEDSVRSLTGRMAEVFGRMDYCVNCAGVSRPVHMHSRFPVTTWPYVCLGQAEFLEMWWIHG
jgi:NAD(P)-dependent dehydrogenase (short-subunit alcohol dehydrogenase family)